MRVHRWPPAVGKKTSAAGDYFQEFIPGTPVSAAYVAAAGSATLIGLTEQFLAGDDVNAQFHYAGSIGPLPISPLLTESLARIGSLLADAFSLLGLFGIDGVLADDLFLPVEINPRYTASMELYDHALGTSLVALHVAACGELRLPVLQSPVNAAWYAKKIVYAPSEIHVPELFEHLLSGKPEAAIIADVPCAGTTIAAGHPVLTILATGPERGTTLEDLRKRESEIIAELK
jgi:predicted ATP-grasp superfamily ATP-dependent carboligase